MRIKVLTSFLLLSLIGLTALQAQQEQSYEQRLYQRKVKSYGKLRKNGFRLATAGGVATVVGFVMIDQAEWEEVPTYNTNGTQIGTAYVTDDSGLTGILLVTAGIPITITGIILGSIGKRKENQYRRKLGRVSFSYLNVPEGGGLHLVYKF